jgi:hypothetical protein
MHALKMQAQQVAGLGATQIVGADGEIIDA